MVNDTTVRQALMTLRLQQREAANEIGWASTPAMKSRARKRRNALEQAADKLDRFLSL